ISEVFSSDLEAGARAWDWRSRSTLPGPPQATAALLDSSSEHPYTNEVTPPPGRGGRDGREEGEDGREGRRLGTEADLSDVRHGSPSRAVRGGGPTRLL